MICFPACHVIVTWHQRNINMKMCCKIIEILTCYLSGNLSKYFRSKSWTVLPWRKAVVWVWASMSVTQWAVILKDRHLLRGEDWPVAVVTGLCCPSALLLFFWLTVIWTGICRSSVEQQYHPVFFFFSRLMLTVMFLRPCLISTEAPSNVPDAPVMHWPPNLHHFTPYCTPWW